VNSNWVDKEKRKKNRLPSDSVAFGLVMAISLLLAYAFKLLIDHTQDYYSQLRSPSYNQQSFKIDPDLIAEAKEPNNDIKVLNKKQPPSQSSNAISASIDSELLSDVLAAEPAEIETPAANIEQTKPNISTAVVA